MQPQKNGSQVQKYLSVRFLRFELTELELAILQRLTVAIQNSDWMGMTGVTTDPIGYGQMLWYYRGHGTIIMVYCHGNWDHRRDSLLHGLFCS